jgi:hypothetical protein
VPSAETFPLSLFFESVSPETWAALAELALSVGDEEQASVLIERAVAASNRGQSEPLAEAA